MNTLQNVYDKLADKTELAKHEVNLGIVQDILKLLSQGQDLNTNASSALDRTLVLYQESLKPLRSANALIEKVKNDARALGLDIPKETLSIFERVDTFINSSNNALKQIKAIN